MKLTPEQFADAQIEAIQKIGALKYGDDPHFIVITGNHDDMELSQVACVPWMKEARDLITESIQQKCN